MPAHGPAGHKLLGWDRHGLLSTDQFGAGHHFQDLVAAPGFAQQISVVFQALGDAGMIRPQGLLHDRQRALVERLGLYPAVKEMPAIRRNRGGVMLLYCSRIIRVSASGMLSIG